jgi:hypothetical protein
MKKSRRNCRKRTLRHTRRRGGAPTNMQIEEWHNFNRNSDLTRPNSRTPFIHAELTNNDRAAHEKWLRMQKNPFKRATATTTVSNTYTPEEITSKIQNSNVYKNQKSNAAKKIIMELLLQNYEDIYIERAKKELIKTPTENKLKAFIKDALAYRKIRIS